MSSITVVQCDNVLLRSFLCIDLPLKWGTLHKFHAQVGDHHNHKYHHNRHHIDCHFQCNDRDPWLRLLHPSDGLLGSEAHPQFLPGGDYVDAELPLWRWWLSSSLSNSNTFYFHSHHHNLRPQIVSGVACIFCGLLQGQTDPDLKNLQVEEHDVFWSDNIQYPSQKIKMEKK